MAELEKVSAEEKATILKRVYDKHGALTPAMVVDESDPSNATGVAHELAHLVEWDLPNEVVASRRREDRARAVIRSCEPELIRLGVFELEAPYYVHDPMLRPGEQGYVPLLSVKSEREVAEDVMAAEVSRAVALLRRSYAAALALELEEQAAALLAALSALGRGPAEPVTAAEVGTAVAES